MSKDIGEVLKYVCSTKQMARKENNDIFISSLTDCTVKITDFTTEQDFMGNVDYFCYSTFSEQFIQNILLNRRLIWSCSHETKTKIAQSRMNVNTNGVYIIVYITICDFVPARM